MAVKKRFGSMKKFGARYGASIKKKAAAIEEELRKKHKCPYCHYNQVKRLSAGIWHCRKCLAKFTGRAYSIVKKKIAEEGGLKS